MRRLLGRLWSDWLHLHRFAVLLVTAMTLAIGAASSIYPAVIQWTFDGLQARDLKVVIYGPLLVMLATALKGAAAFAQDILTNRIVTRVEADMQSALYAHLIDADLAQHEAESAASLTQRFTTDFATIRESVTKIVTVVGRDVAILIGVLGWMLWNDWQLTLCALVLAPLFIRPVMGIGRRLRRTSAATQQQFGAMASQVLESLSAVRFAKTFALEPHLKERARGSFDRIRQLKMKAAVQRGRLEPLLELSAGVAIAAVLAVVGWRIVHGASTVGNFIAVVTALIIAAQPIRSIGNLNAIIQETLASLQRYYDIMDVPPRIADSLAATALEVGEATIHFDRVTFGYQQAGPVLRDLTLDVRGGTTTALVGRSGSGKSTLLSLVPRLYDVTSGAVRINGRDIRAVTLASLRAHIAVVSQDIVLFDDTVRANIALGRQGADDSAIIAAAKAAAAHDFITALPDGYETRVGDRGMRLSGGERQRIALARAIVKDAPILLLDEATSALDAESEQLVQEALARLMKGRTTLVIAHRLSTIRAADSIVVMEDGSVVESGQHDALLAKGGAYARLHALQFDMSPG